MSYVGGFRDPEHALYHLSSFPTKPRLGQRITQQNVQCPFVIRRSLERRGYIHARENLQRKAT